MGAEIPRQENVGLNGIAGIVGVNATVEYLLGNDDPDLHLTKGNDLVFEGKGSGGNVDEGTVKAFGRYLETFGNQGRKLVDEPIRTSAQNMAVVRTIEVQGNKLRFVVDRYVTHPDTGRYMPDPLHPVRDETVELSAVRNPREIPWGDGDRPVGHVIDATTQVVTADQIRGHIRDSVTQAVKTAPAKGDYDFLWVAGITDEGFKPENHRTIAEGACTLQCFGAVMAPLFKIRGFTPRRIEFSTIHGVTGDQTLVRRFKPEDMPRGLPGDEDIIRTKSGSAGDLSQLVRFLARKNWTFGNPDTETVENEIQSLIARTQLTAATRVPAKDSATLDFRVEVDEKLIRDDITNAYRNFSREHPEVLQVQEDPVAIASSTIRGHRESGIMFLDSITVEDGRIIRGTAGYAHEDNSPHASMRISKMIAAIKRREESPLQGGMAG